MRLDVVVPTFNRSDLLRRTIDSLLLAAIPEGLEVSLIIVDNNSKDDTAQVVQQLQSQTSRHLQYVKETRAGLSRARNAGIAAGIGDLIGFIDDDEEVDPLWYQVVAREFSDPRVDFIGGPYLPNWAAPAPPWLPPGYNSAIGVVLPKPRSSFGAAFAGNLMGGNAVVRRRVYDRIGTYATHLGRSGKGLLSEEDAEFCRRLEEAKVHGMYVPDLVIHHYIPAARLTRNYHRRWAYWRAVSQGALDRERKEPVPYIFGIPRYRIGRALRGAIAYPGHALSRVAQGQAFADELAAWDLIGFIYGRHFARIGELYAD